MIKLSIPLKAMSVNKLFQGRRFKTKAYNQYSRDFLFYAKAEKVEKMSGYFKITIKFHLINWRRTDSNNLTKALFDSLVKADIIEDDRFDMEEHIYKVPDKTDFIEIEIEKWPK